MITGMRTFLARHRLLIGVVASTTTACAALGWLIARCAGDAGIGAAAGLMVYAAYWFMVFGSMHDDGRS